MTAPPFRNLSRPAPDAHPETPTSETTAVPPQHGLRGLHYTESDIDPTLLMNGTYASKQMNGLYGSKSLGVFCLTDYRCSPQAQQSSAGWNP
jgi:hypothetical protein